jgi:catechol 2,3-dioxygenase-like lactoylglutathione lyase family enzyme
VQVKGLAWLGVRTSKFDETVEFLKEVLGLKVSREDHDFAVLKLPNDDAVEVFGPSDEQHNFFTTGPVVGLLVEDTEKARLKMEAEGIEFIGPIHHHGQSSWSHFRGPDGIIYEILSRS